jgi:teichuronic acid biosynthesis glycosyltransferase TuaG
MNNPMVSVIMPAFNAERYIEEAINSVISQTYTNWELIVINDGSTDNTLQIANKFVSVDARVKLISQDNKKLGAARNAGILNANGIWIAFLDADDLWMPDKLTKQLLIAKAEPGAGVIFTDGFTFYDNSLQAIQPYETVSGYFTSTVIYKLEYQGNYIPVLSVLVKKAHIDSIGLQNVYGCEDWDYWLRLALHGVSFYGMNEKLFYYRRHSSNMSNDNNLMNLAKATVFIKNFKKELFSKEEAVDINAFINRTICSFIKLGKIKEALFLNNSMYAASKGAFRKLSAFFISKLGNRSYYLTRLVFKADSILTW